MLVKLGHINGSLNHGWVWIGCAKFVSPMDEHMGLKYAVEE